MISTAVLLGTALLVAVFYKVALSVLGTGRRRRVPYPPGPPPMPLIGNTLDFPAFEPGPVFAEWGKKYQSDLLHASALGNHLVVVNSQKIAEDLFDKRAHLYSDRPHVPIGEIFDLNNYHISFLRYGDDLRKHRTLCQQYFGVSAAKHYHPIQRKRVHHYLHGLLMEPDKAFEHSKMLSVSITLFLMYGYEPETLDDAVIHVGDESSILAATLLGFGGSLANVIPILRHIPPWVPGAVSQKKAHKVKDLLNEMKRIPLEHIQRESKNGTIAPSLISNFLEKKNSVGVTEEEERIVNNVAWTTYGAASDTTIATTGTFLYLMAKHPDVQIKARREIDRVVGNDRLPDFSDRDSMPYIEAIYREVLRYRPALAVGIPHALTEDDYYDGYFLPKGATVISNIWAMSRDERVYPEPDLFKPERYLNPDGTINENLKVVAYGFGRRICIGKPVASSTMWLIISCFLACFDIGKAKDKLGNEIEIDDTYEDAAVLSHKKPFKCSIKPRSEQVVTLIKGLSY